MPDVPDLPRPGERHPLRPDDPTGPSGRPNRNEHSVLILTQPALRTDPLLQALREHGVAFVHWPMSRLEPEPGLDWDALLRSLDGCRWVFLPSPGVVAIVMARLAERGLGWPADCGVALIGPGSRAELDRWAPRVPGLAEAPVVSPSREPFDAAGLLAEPALADLAGQRVAVLRRADGREDWLATLRGRGALLEATIVYRSTPLAPGPAAAAWLQDRAGCDAPVAFSVTSAGVAERLGRWVGAQACARWAFAQPALAVHPRIAQALRSQGWQRVHLHAPGPAGLLHGVECAAGGAR
jgi:uroporphyrinogen-III synthase